jgi:hypothetical protein
MTCNEENGKRDIRKELRKQPEKLDNRRVPVNIYTNIHISQMRRKCDASVLGSVLGRGGGGHIWRCQNIDRYG